MAYEGDTYLEESGRQVLDGVWRKEGAVYVPAGANLAKTFSASDTPFSGHLGRQAASRSLQGLLATPAR